MTGTKVMIIPLLFVPERLSFFYFLYVTFMHIRENIIRYVVKNSVLLEVLKQSVVYDSYIYKWFTHAYGTT